MSSIDEASYRIRPGWLYSFNSEYIFPNTYNSENQVLLLSEIWHLLVRTTEYCTLVPVYLFFWVFHFFKKGFFLLLWPSTIAHSYSQELVFISITASIACVESLLFSPDKQFEITLNTSIPGVRADFSYLDCLHKSWQNLKTIFWAPVCLQ